MLIFDIFAAASCCQAAAASRCHAVRCRRRRRCRADISFSSAMICCLLRLLDAAAMIYAMRAERSALIRHTQRMRVYNIVDITIIDILLYALDVDRARAETHYFRLLCRYDA